MEHIAATVENPRKTMLKMMFIAKVMRSWNEHSDALAFEEVKGSVGDVEHNVPNFICIFISDTVRTDYGCFVGMADVVFG